jgi:hypothetical protein
MDEDDEEEKEEGEQRTLYEIADTPDTGPNLDQESPRRRTSGMPLRDNSIRSTAVESTSSYEYETQLSTSVYAANPSYNRADPSPSYNYLADGIAPNAPLKSGERARNGGADSKPKAPYLHVGTEDHKVDDLYPSEQELDRALYPPAPIRKAPYLQVGPETD